MIVSAKYEPDTIRIGTYCVICGKDIEIPCPSAVVNHVCDECLKRLKNLLYPHPPEIKIEIKAEELLQHVGYDSDQLGRDK